MEEECKSIAVEPAPRRIRGTHTRLFKTAKIDLNYYPVNVNNSIENIFIYKVVFSPAIPHDNSKLRMSILHKLIREIKEFIPSPVLSGSNIYSLKAPSVKEK